MGSNNKSYITTLWVFLIATKWLRLDEIMVYGDAKGITHWVNKNTNLNPTIL